MKRLTKGDIERLIKDSVIVTDCIGVTRVFTREFTLVSDSYGLSYDCAKYVLCVDGGIRTIADAVEAEHGIKLHSDQDSNLASLRGAVATIQDVIDTTG